MNNMIFYFHGFASSEKSWKVQLLKSFMGTENVTAPTLPVNPKDVIQLFEHSAEEHGKPQLLLGSSLGGFYALYAALEFDIPALLLNPSITPWITLENYVGQHNRYYTNEPFQWKKEYLETLELMNRDIEKLKSKQHLLHFFLAADDEVLDLEQVPKEFPDAGSIRFLENCGHRFSRFEEILPEIKGILGS